MDEKPLRLLSELRSPQHRPPMLAFLLVAAACTVVIATGIRFDSVSSVVNPWPRWLYGAIADLATDDDPSLRAVQAGSVIEPEESPEPSPSAPSSTPATGPRRSPPDMRSGLRGLRTSSGDGKPST